MRLRRTILLFAIVLGLAAIASSLAQSPDDGSSDRDPDRSDTTAAVPDAGPTTDTGVQTVELQAGARKRTVRLQVDRPATVVVAVDAAGLVEIPSLGLVQPGEPLTPARFDVLVSEPGSHEVILRPASQNPPRSVVGTLEVTP